jgi:glycosyltransferase involved in cell wall biosynthesis
MRAVGPGGPHLGDELAFGSGPSRMDAWRWFTKALAVFQPAPHLAVAALSAEAMAFGVPIVAPDTGGASRDYADDGDGGLWFRSYGELLGLAQALLDADLRQTLGAQAERFASAHFADSGAYVERVTAAISSLD